MKIVIVKTKGVLPLELKGRHLAQVRGVKGDLEVVAVEEDSREELEKQLETAEIAAGFPWALASLPLPGKLKWVHSFSAGMDRALTPELVESDIIASNSAGIHAFPIAEHIMGFLLLFSRRFYQSFKRQEEKIWEKDQEVTELKGKTVLILGLGNIGREAARLAGSFGMEVLAFDKAGKEKPSFVAKAGGEGELPGMLSVADFAVLCLPHTKDTHHFLNKEKLEAMKKSAFVINIGRGGVIDEQALIAALKEKKIAGAGLDVTETEPLPKESPLWDMENVILTPHHSGWSEKYMDRAIERFCLNLKAFLEGKPLPNSVDKQAGY